MPKYLNTFDLETSQNLKFLVMKKCILIILLPFLLICMKSKAQDSLGISPYSVVVGNDTLANGTIDSISFWVKNNGFATFNDSVTFYTSVQDSVSAFVYYPIDSVDFGLVTIPPGDSIPFTLYNTFTVAPLRFHYDINVIVIWPVASVSGNSDSLFYAKVITLADGIDKIDLGNLIKTYPNPTINNFTLENSSKNSIEEVRIYDSQGRLVESLNKTDFIYTEKWVPGTYLINIQLENKQTHTIRVIKQ